MLSVALADGRRSRLTVGVGKGGWLVVTDRVATVAGDEPLLMRSLPCAAVSLLASPNSPADKGAQGCDGKGLSILSVIEAGDGGGGVSGGGIGVGRESFGQSGGRWLFIRTPVAGLEVSEWGRFGGGIFFREKGSYKEFARYPLIP